jgi:N-methylhydantoinase B
MTSTTRTSPITREVVLGGLSSAAAEMSEALRRSSYSPIIREMIDYSCAIFDPSGRLVAQAENIPAHLGSMGYALAHVLERVGPAGLQPGDAWLTNDPYGGGTHTPDLHVFTGAFDPAGRLIGMLGTIAHHVDVGGKNPGTEGFDNRTIFEEGLRLPPVRLATGGELDHQVLAIVAANVREPSSTTGDLRAQLAACHHGEARLRALAARYGTETLATVMAEALDASEALLRARLGALPDGTVAATGVLDDDGLGGPPVAIEVALTVDGDRLLVDFTGTSAQLSSGMNVPPAAATSAVIYAVKTLLAPDDPPTAGMVRALDVVLPPGSLVNPAFPAAVSLRHLAVQRIADTLIRALGELVPERRAAGCFVGFLNLTLESRHPRTGETRVPQDCLGGGMGGWPGGDGLDAVDTHLSNVALLPAEVCELDYQLRVLRTELIPGSGGAGQWRGGLGLRREYEVLAVPQRGLVYGEQLSPAARPWPLAGGEPGRRSRMTLHRTDGTSEPMTKSYFTAEPGDRIIIETSGGGGYGDPVDRDPRARERDVREGKV